MANPAQTGNNQPDSNNNEQISYHDISELEAHKISAADIKRLKEDNYFSVESIVNASHKDLITVKGISETKAEELQNAGIYMHSLRTY